VPTTDTITRETTLCISLAARPSNIGTRFHNFLYDELDLNYLYKAFAPTDIAGAISGVRALGIRGCACRCPTRNTSSRSWTRWTPPHRPSNPSTLSSTPTATSAPTTPTTSPSHRFWPPIRSPPTTTSPSWAAAAWPRPSSQPRDSGFRNGHIIARDENTGHTLAEQYGFKSTTQIGDLRPRLIINATPIGMTGGPNADDLSFDPDVVAFPATTPLITLADNLGKKTISGAEVIALQAAEQFVL